MNKFIAYFTPLPDVYEVKPVTVQLGDQTFEGISYNEGGETRLCLAGVIPECTCYRFADDARDWFVSGRGADHPLGDIFYLQPWTIADPIDSGAWQSYPRIPAKYL